MFLEYDWLVAGSHWLRLGHKVLVALTEHFLKFVKQNYTKDFPHTLSSNLNLQVLKGWSK